MLLSWMRAVFAWEAYEKGTDVHVQADPTKLELLSREFNKRKDTFLETKKESIVSKYGGEEHLDAPPKQLLLAQTVCMSVCPSVYHVCVFCRYRYTSFSFLTKRRYPIPRGTP